MTLAADHFKLTATPAQCVAGYAPPTTSSNYLSYFFWDINGAPFNASVYTPYVTQILTGLKLTYYFDYSTECTGWV